MLFRSRFRHFPIDDQNYDVVTLQNTIPQFDLYYLGQLLFVMSKKIFFAILKSDETLISSYLHLFLLWLEILQVNNGKLNVLKKTTGTTNLEQ